MFERFKGSAIHNLIITSCGDSLNEGLFLDRKIMDLADLQEGQEIIITRIGADSWGNRIRTIVFSSENEGEAKVCGSLSKFLSVGELTCVIGEFYLDADKMNKFNKSGFPIFDLGFAPDTNKDNKNGNLDFQFSNRTKKGIKLGSPDYFLALKSRVGLQRMYAKSMVIGLKVNKTHPDCLQGSAELPGSVMVGANIQKYKSVTVYNQSQGGAADTYAVPMPEGVVMTTGAMASFAKIGESVNIVSYVISSTPIERTIIFTNGEKII